MDYEAKIAALFRQAESTTFPEEAEACFKKAQELLTTHQISEARVRGLNANNYKIDHLKVEVPGSSEYIAKYSAQLLSNVAKNNGCKVVWSRTHYNFDEKGRREWYQTIWLSGVVEEIFQVWEMFWQINIQMQRFLVEAKTSDQKPYCESMQKFTKGFIVGFADRIGSRLYEARKQVVEAERVQTPDLLPILANKDTLVMNAFRERWPNLGRARAMDVGSAVGRAAGYAAGNKASLGQRGIGGRKALGA